MNAPRSYIQALCLFLSVLLVLLVSCGNPRGKDSRGRQQNEQNEQESSAIEQEEGEDELEDEIIERGGKQRKDGTGGGKGSFDTSSMGDDTPTKAALASMPKSHPRLMLGDDQWKGLDKRRKTDKALTKLIRDAINKANRYLKAPTMKYTNDGPVMLRTAHEALKRSYSLGFAWRATKDKRYAKKLEENLLTICGFKDWTPDHFLATAEMSHAVGIGYDWGFDGLSSSAKATIVKKLMKNGLKPGLADMNRVPEVNWTKSEYNWNLVCNGGLVIGALAIADEEAEMAEDIVDFARVSMKKALRTYGPDGAWPEGPGYWSYATDYAVYALAAMHTALGTEFGLSKIEGLSKTGFFASAMTAPSGKVAAFADVAENSTRNSNPVLFWLASHYGRSELAAEELAYLAKNKGDVQHIIWYPPESMTGANRPTPPLDAFFRGKIEVLFMRGGHKVDDVFVPFKAGFNQVHHGHLDLGNFEFEALGVRWARDLGSDNYGLPGYWESRPGGRRWDHWRLGSFSHNVLTFGGKQQAVTAKSSFTSRSIDGAAEPFGVVEITKAYPKVTGPLSRGVKLLNNRTAMLVQDEFDLLKSTEIAWGMTTDAKITLSGSKATLKQDGKTMIATIIEPAEGIFSMEAAPNKAGAKSNKGVSRLLIRTKAKAGAQRIVVLLSPVGPNGGAMKSAPVKPLSKW